MTTRLTITSPVGVAILVLSALMGAMVAALWLRTARDDAALAGTAPDSAAARHATRGEARTGGPPAPAADRTRVGPGSGTETHARGTLRDAAGAPLAGVWASLVFVADDGTRVDAAVDERGRYTAVGLGPGCWRARGRCDGYRPLADRIEVPEGSLVVSRDFVLERAPTLEIRVRAPDGRPFWEVARARGFQERDRQRLMAVATRGHPGDRLPGLRSGRNSRFGIAAFTRADPRPCPADSIGALALDEDLPAYVSLVCYESVLRTYEVDAGSESVTFTLDPGALRAHEAAVRVRVVDTETRAPIAGGLVSLAGGRALDPGVPSDADGRVSLRGRSPGRLTLSIRAPGYESYHREVDVARGEVTDLGTIALARETRVEARVIDRRGRPVATSFVAGEADGGGAVRLDPSLRASSGPDGRLAIRGLGRGAYVVRTDRGHRPTDGADDGTVWMSGNVVLRTADGSVEGAVITLEPARVLVLRASRETRATVRFALVDDKGLELRTGFLGRAQARTLRVPAGTYRLRTTDLNDRAVACRDIDVGAEPTTVLLGNP